MITATVSHEMRTPINAILTQLDNLNLMIEENDPAIKMARVIKNSAQLLLFLVNDMLDVYMLKNGKFEMIEQRFMVKKFFQEVNEMFVLQAQTKNIKVLSKFSEGIPYAVSTDERRMK